MLTHALGSETIDVTIPGAQGGATTLTTSQHFATVQELNDQIIDARVWIGFHYRTSVVAGEDLGDSVADWALQRYFQSGDNEGDSDSGDNG